MMFTTNEQYLTTKDAANHLKLKPGTIRFWCRQGIVPSIRVRRQYRILLSDIVAIMKQF